MPREDRVKKQMHLLQMFIHSLSTHTSMAWMDPRDEQADGLASFAYWQKLAKTLERGCFDGIFFADVAAVHEQYKDSSESCIRYGVSWPNHDPMPLVAVMAAATEHLGFGVTLSTTGTTPYLAVRRISTLDYLSGGRVGWNIVTGINRGEHRANGMEMMDHDQRYDYADEYMDICYALWGSVPHDAILANRQTGEYADASRVRTVDYEGKYLSTYAVGPTLPSPQGRPVLFQAGSSSRGLEFAVKHADVIFTIQPHVDGMKKFVDKARVQAGAGAPVPRVFVGVQPIIASTEAEARQRAEELRARPPLEAVLSRISGNTGVDFSKYDLDMPIAELTTQASRGMLEAISAREDGKPATLRDAAMKSTLALGIPALIGTPEQVATRMEEIWLQSGAYGLNISPTTAPDSVEDFVDHVIPILQKRGVFRTSYPGKTFRETLDS